MKETWEDDRQIIEHTSPLWRLIGVAGLFGGLYYLGVWVRDAGFERQFATVFTVALLFSAGFWARQRPDRLRKTLGSFGGIAVEVQRSGDRIRADVYRRPLAFGVFIGCLYGGLVVAIQALVATLLASLLAWQLAVGVGAIIGGIVAAPDFFKSAYNSISVSDDEDEDDFEEPLEDEDLEDDELARRRRAAGEE